MSKESLHRLWHLIAQNTNLILHMTHLHSPNFISQKCKSPIKPFAMKTDAKILRKWLQIVTDPLRSSAIHYAPCLECLLWDCFNWLHWRPMHFTFICAHHYRNGIHEISTWCLQKNIALAIRWSDPPCIFGRQFFIPRVVNNDHVEIHKERRKKLQHLGTFTWPNEDLCSRMTWELRTNS